MPNTPDPNSPFNTEGQELFIEPDITLVDDHGNSVLISNAKPKITKSPTGGISSIDYGQGLTFVEQEIRRRYQDLPAAKLPENNIKFLGSSYSGVDIKVVAHMYDQKNIKDEEMDKLNRQKDIADRVANACQQILLNSSGLEALAEGVEGYSARRDAFLNVAGFGALGQESDEAQKARDIIVGTVWKNSNFTFLGIAQMKRRAEALKDRYEDQSIELTNRIKDISNLEKLETSSTVVLGSLQTISVQTFREKNAVRALGHSYAKGYTRGARTIGGSCIFTIFNENALASLIRGMASSTTYGERDTELSTLLPDQLPPLDLTIAFANEYGALSDFRLYGVEFFTDGSVFSIEDLLSEETMNFVCRDADIMTSRGRISLSRLQRGMHNGKDDKDKSGTSLLFDNQDYYNYLDRLGVRRRLLNR